MVSHSKWPYHCWCYAVEATSCPSMGSLSLGEPCSFSYFVILSSGRDCHLRCALLILKFRLRLDSLLSVNFVYWPWGNRWSSQCCGLWLVPPWIIALWFCCRCSLEPWFYLHHHLHRCIWCFSSSLFAEFALETKLWFSISICFTEVSFPQLDLAQLYPLVGSRRIGHLRCLDFMLCCQSQSICCSYSTPLPHGCWSLASCRAAHPLFPTLVQLCVPLLSNFVLIYQHTDICYSLTLGLQLSDS